MRRAARVDANHGEVRDHLEAHGWTTWSTAPLGGDFPDLIVAKLWFVALVEVKDGAKSPSKRKLSEGQQKFRDTWPGVVITALNPAHALLQLEAWRARFQAIEPVFSAVSAVRD